MTKTQNIISIPLIRILILYVILTSCNGNNHQNSPELNTIKISDDMFDNKMDYSDIIQITDVVRLETDAQSIIGKIRKIECNNNRFYISDDSHQLLIFDTNGKFLSKLTKGKGPKEFIELRDFNVNKSGIAILSNKTLLYYTPDGKFLNTKKLNLQSASGRDLNPILFLPIKEDLYLYMGSFALNHIIPRENNAIYQINSGNKIVSEYFPITSGLTGHQTFYKSGNIINLSVSYGNDTIYKVTSSGIHPKTVVDFLNKRITEKDMMGDRDILFHKIWENNYNGLITNIYENDNYLCFSFSSGKTRKNAVLNKKTNLLEIINAKRTLPVPFAEINGIIENDFFSILDPFMLQAFNKDHFYDDFYNKYNLNDLKPEDNPLIVRFKFIF